MVSRQKYELVRAESYELAILCIIVVLCSFEFVSNHVIETQRLDSFIHSAWFPWSHSCLKLEIDKSLKRTREALPHLPQ